MFVSIQTSNITTLQTWIKYLKKISGLKKIEIKIANKKNLSWDMLDCNDLRLSSAKIAINIQ